KVPNAMPPPAATPAASRAPNSRAVPAVRTATASMPARHTRLASSPGPIDLVHPTEVSNCPVQVHAGGRDAKPKACQQEPRTSAQQEIGTIARSQPDHGAAEQRGAQLSQRRQAPPRRVFSRRSHVNRNTS